MSFFSSSSTSSFSFITIDATLLQGIYSAQSARALANSVPQQQRSFNTSPAVTAPWQLNQEIPSLSRAITSARQLSEFIDLNAETVKAAGDDPDAQAAFAIYNALTNLETLARYAAEDGTLESELGRLSATFELGLGQVQDFVASQSLDKLDLLFGGKENDIEATAVLGEDDNSYQGSVLQTGAREDVIEALDGSETFSITLTKSGRTDVIAVDLSEIVGDLTIDAVVDHANAQIAALKLVDEDGNPQLDENGDPILDEDGNTVARYLTRFEVRSNEDFDWLIGLDGVETEAVSFDASGDPSVYVASTFDSVVTDAQDFGRINQFTFGAEGFTTANRTTIAAGSAALTALAQDVAVSNGTDIDEDPIDDVTLSTRTDAIAVDSNGFTYILGTSSGDVGTQLGDGQDDAFLTKLDSEGQVVFQRLLGSEGTSTGYALAIDSDDNVIIAGQTTGRVDASDALAGNDSFVVKYNSSGSEVFRSQLDSFVSDGAFALTTNDAGDVFVGGYASGSINTSTTASGGRDGLLMRLEGSTGAISDVALFGTSGTDEVKALTIDADGNVLAAVEEDGRGVVIKFDPTDLSNELLRTDLGDLNGGSLSGIAVTQGAGPVKIVVAGTTANAGDLNGGTQVNASSGDQDAFVTTLSDTGASLDPQVTRFIGTSAADTANGLAVDGDDIYITGRTFGELEGQTRQGARDGFVAKIDAQSGDLDSLNQFGAFGGRSNATGIAVSTAGESTLSKLGLRTGPIGDTQARNIGTQTSLTDGQYFYVAVDGGTPRKITVDADDTYRTIASKINVLGLNSVKAEDDDGVLKIEAINDGRVDFIAGPDGQDALARLGIEPQSILSSERLFNFEDDRPPEEQLGGTFGLGLEGSFNLSDKTTAKYVLTKIESALSTVQRAFRSLTFDPIAFQLEEQGKFQGQVPTYLTNQLANYQSALARLQGGQSSSGFTV